MAIYILHQCKVNGILKYRLINILEYVLSLNMELNLYDKNHQLIKMAE